MEDTEVLRHRIALRPGVVLQEFPTETVVLHLTTGRFHSLNATAATMLDAVLGGGPARAAVPALTTRLEASEAVLAADLAGLLRGLLERDVIVLEGA